MILCVFFLFALVGQDPVRDDRVEQRTIVVKPVDQHWEMHFKQRVTMKTKAGLRLARFAIPVSPRRQMRDFSGTLTLGKRTDPAGKPKIYKQGDGDISDSKYWSVMVPGLKPKSRFEYSYTYIMDSPAWLPPFWFGDDFPTDEVLVEIHLPPGQTIDYGFINPDDLPIKYEKDTHNGLTVHRFTAHNLPASSNANRSAHLFTGIHTTGKQPWRAVSDQIRDMYAEIVTGNLSQAASELAGHTEREAYLKAAYELVRDQIRYESIPLGDHDIKAASPYTVHYNRYGDCKDKAWLLHHLLKLRGIESHPVLVAVNTRLAPKPDVAALNRFDHMILAVAGPAGYRFLDATSAEELDQLPAGDRGAEALIILPDGYQRLQLPDEAPPQKWGINANLDQAGTVTWRIQLRQSDLPIREIIDSQTTASRPRQERAIAASLLAERLHNRLHLMTFTAEAEEVLIQISEPVAKIGELWIVPESPLPAPVTPIRPQSGNHSRIRREVTIDWTLPQHLKRPETPPVEISSKGYRVHFQALGNQTSQQLAITARTLDLAQEERLKLSRACAERYWNPVKRGTP